MRRSSRFVCRACVLLAILVVASPAVADEPTPEQLDFFEKNIRPVLAENCYRCHSAGGKQRGGLLVDSRDALLRGGENGPAIVPGQPSKSRLFQAISYVNPKLKMPRDGKLPQQQIEDIGKWIAMGAPWPAKDKATKVLDKKFDLAARAKHWCYQPVKAQPLPQVKTSGWATSPIDYFILAKLEQAGLAPNPPADRATLLRRVYFDLIGLPPTPSELEAFQKDDSPKAFEKVVDRLLASTHYGERWARHWLDLVRFAETCGHEFDFELPEAWKYRDHVIRAFNDDVPYNQLVREHVAGDLLPQPRKNAAGRFNESILGTGFWFLGENKHSPVDVLGDQADRIDNQIDVFAKTFLGLTVSCARCHDHKFDAITTKDYYALVGYLQSSRFQRAFIDDPEVAALAIAALTKSRDEAIKLAIPATAALLKRRANALFNQLGGLANKAVSESWSKVLQQRAADARHPLHPFLTLAKANPSDFVARRVQLAQQLAALDQASAKAEAFAAFNGVDYGGWFVTGPAFGARPAPAGTLLLQPGNSGQPVRQVLAVPVAHSGIASGRLQGALRSPSFVINHNTIHYLVRGTGGRIRLIVDGYLLIKDPIYGKLDFEVRHGDEPRWHSHDVSMWRGHRAYIEVLDDGDGWVGVDRVLFADGGPPANPVNAAVLELVKNSKSKSLEALATEFRGLLSDTLEQWQAGALDGSPQARARIELINSLLNDPVVQALPAGQAKIEWGPALAEALKKLQQAEAKLPPSSRAMAMMDGTPVDEKVYVRGNHNTKGAEVPRRFLEVFGGETAPPGPASGRLQLADSLVDPANPLTARVMVNRIWKHHFGQGIVASVDNFGVLGDRPSHPELLDWLAGEFVRRGWSIKKMHRLMVLSSTYRMSSKADPAAGKVDPDNRLLQHMPVRRLEGEAIRDALLSVSGRLNPAMFGPGVLPHLTPHMIGRGRPAQSGPLDGDGRRSIYINVRRNFLTPLFLVFDYPVPFTTIGKRSVSNVPAQALTMLNNPFVLQQTKLWSERILAQPGLTSAQRLEVAFLTALGRKPSAAESGQLLGFLQTQSKVYGRPDDPRAWQDLCHVIVNLKEFIYVY